jgi:hypothetical protein
MAKCKDITGQKFNRLTAIKRIEGTKWLFKCDCGIEKILTKWDVMSGNTKSCGCLNAELIKIRCKENMTKHGMYQTKEYRAWHSMKDRCLCPTNKFYDYYGGRGIKICDSWLNSFENFFKDMGYAPTQQHSIDRIDNNGNYEPNNCRWATKREQVINRRNSFMITYKGETKAIAEWSDIYGICINVIRKRIKLFGWDVEKAFTTPVREKRKPHCQ